MSSALYHSFLLSHYRSPQNYGLREGFDVEAKGENRTCGDSLVVRVKWNGDVISEICFQHEGCVISRASASLFYDYLRGKTRLEIAELAPDDVLCLLGAPITPGRIPCALLPLETIKKIA